MTNNKQNNKLAIITPLKDEIENIENFLNSVSSLNNKIDCLIILENDSSDGSKEYLENINNVENIDYFKVINLSFEDKAYDVEFKYAQIISEGLRYLKSLDLYVNIEYVGILDSDCFPESDYYEILLKFLNENPKVGLSSGLIYLPEGKRHIANKNWVRGGCRVWKKECLEQTGFPIAPSPDTITVALAEIYGWEAKTCKNAKVYSREVNDRLANYKNFGARAYYRGNTVLFALLKMIYFTFLKLKPKIGFDFLVGFLNELKQKNKRIDNPLVLKYYKFYLFNKLKNKLGF